jgi:hypothetical protein
VARSLIRTTASARESVSTRRHVGGVEGAPAQRPGPEEPHEGRPERLAHQHQGKPADLRRLDERGRLEDFVEGAQAALHAGAGSSQFAPAKHTLARAHPLSSVRKATLHVQRHTLVC